MAFGSRNEQAFFVGGQSWLLLTAPLCPVVDTVGLADFLQQRDWAAVELRCLPYDTPRHFDPVTLTGDAVGGAAVAVSEAALAQAGGLDRCLPPEAALLDLSLRLTAQGGVLGYCPFVSVQLPPQPDGAQRYVQELAGRVLLAKKYGTAAQVRAERKRYKEELRRPSRHFAGVRKALLRAVPQMAAAALSIRPCAAATWEDVIKPREIRGQSPLQPFAQTPLVSVVVRTCHRPAVLCHTLQCLRNQTYRHIEVVVVEDGEAQSAERIQAQLPDLPVRYFATGEHVGRGKAGNVGLQMARGEFVCFLDDDDFFYPDHLELCLSHFYQQPEKDMAFSGFTAFEAEIHSKDPYAYTIQRIYPVLFDHLDLMDMCVKCRLPVSGVLFRRELFAQHGGMREDIDGDEDWAMWLRYWRTARRAEDTRLDVPRATSMCGFPADKAQAEERMAAYAVYDDIMLADPALRFTQDVEKVRGWQNRLKGDLAHLVRLGCAEQLLATADPEKAAWPPLPQHGEVTLTAAQIRGLHHALLCRAAQAQAEGRLEAWLEQAE